MSGLHKLVDVAASALVTLGAPLFRKVGYWPANYPGYLKRADRAGVQWRSTHYYHPTYADSDLPQDVTGERELPGLDLRQSEQLALLRNFGVQDELREIGSGTGGALDYQYDNEQYGPGDADSLYAMIRTVKPRRMFEIGSGNSTRIAAKALARNLAEDPASRCRHLCIEPFEMPWLEQLGPEIVRQRVEQVDLSLFAELEDGDILFIDSSHVIRPFGDVLVEFQSIIPRLANGVLVHVHDIFTPRDYPERWLRQERRLWNEQYLLETMLAHSSRYEVRLALNWLQNNHPAEMQAAFPILREKPDAQPGAFWFEIVG